MRAAWMLVLVACGRIAFDPRGDVAGDATGSGTAADAAQVTCTGPCFVPIASSTGVIIDEPRVNYRVVGSTLYFVANDEVTGAELWKSDGSEAGTQLVRDIHPTSDSNPYHFVELNGQLLFFADDGTNGRELWRTDGTTAGTVMVRDIHPTGSAVNYVWRVRAVNGRIIFAANDGTNGEELWASDGTTLGTTMIKDFVAGTGTGYPRELFAMTPTLALVNARDGTNGTEVWRTDGTAAGTQLVSDVVTGSIGSLPDGWFRYFGVIGGWAYYRGNDGVSGLELWRTNGTVAELVADIEPGPTDGMYGSPWCTPALGRIFFHNQRSTALGNEPYVTDGTSNGTFMLGDLNPAGSALPLNANPLFTEHNGRVFFRASNGTDGTELWITDGTQAGTRMAANIHPTTGSSPGSFFAWNGVLHFTADDGVYGRELWASDGTSSGTRLIQDLSSMSSNPWFMGWIGTTPMLVATDDAGVDRLWVGR